MTAPLMLMEKLSLSRGDFHLGAIDLRLESGTMLALLGPNGSGKTSLLELMAGLLRPDSGTILVDGPSGPEPLERWSRREIARFLAVVPQEHEAVFPFTVREFVLMGRYPCRSLFSPWSRRDQEVAAEAIRAVGLGPLADRSCTCMSGGERRLLLIARALAQEARVLLLDEPDSHLDLGNRTRVLALLGELSGKRGITIVMSLHDPNLALRHADRVVLLQGGSIVGQGEPGSVLTRGRLESTYGLEMEEFRGAGESLVFHPRSLAGKDAVIG